MECIQRNYDETYLYLFTAICELCGSQSVDNWALQRVHSHRLNDYVFAYTRVCLTLNQIIITSLRAGNHTKLAPNIVDTFEIHVPPDSIFCFQSLPGCEHLNNEQCGMWGREAFSCINHHNLWVQMYVLLVCVRTRAGQKCRIRR